eukprot:COSAG02_NODE_23654_length_712_cov_0.652529_2_plen_42_part_01
MQTHWQLFSGRPAALCGSNAQDPLLPGHDDLPKWPTGQAPHM